MTCNITFTGVFRGMAVILEKCAGPDVHQEIVFACVLYGDLDRKSKQEIRTLIFPWRVLGCTGRRYGTY
ncbi:hypothetical protein D3C81_919530 [compost metagenome]